MRILVGMFVAAVAASLSAFAPATAEAQACVDASTCPVGTACMNGQCVNVGAGPVGQPAPVYGAPPPVGPAYGQAPAPAAPATRTEQGHITGLIVAGAVVLGAGWLTNIIVSLGAGASIIDPSEDWAPFRFTGLVPVLGPWIQLGIKPGNAIGRRNIWGEYLVIDGVFQLAGLAMLIAGIVVPVERTVRADGGTGIDLAVVPSLSPNYSGLDLIGRF